MHTFSEYQTCALLVRRVVNAGSTNKTGRQCTHVMAVEHALCFSTMLWRFWVVDILMYLRMILYCLLAGRVR